MRGRQIVPVALEKNECFVADMYKTLRFVQHPETSQWYLSVISEGGEVGVTYDYLKVSKEYKTPSTLLKAGHYDKALAGYLEIKKRILQVS
ncbi:hypothetical protein [Winogradskyella sp. PC D3.3]